LTCPKWRCLNLPESNGEIREEAKEDAGEGSHCGSGSDKVEFEV
jgi:hypothetical protein